MSELKPCPFCGSADVCLRFKSFYVECQVCGAEGGWNDESVMEAIDSWNRRTPASEGEQK